MSYLEQYSTDEGLFDFLLPFDACRPRIDGTPAGWLPLHAAVTMPLRTAEASLSRGVMVYERQLDPCGCGTTSHHTHPLGLE